MKNAIRAIIIDDEMHCRENLKMLIEDFNEGIEVLGLASGAEEGRKMVEAYHPDVVFLDVMMPNEDGFSFLNSLPERNFSVVFTTAHNEYALKAIKQSAVDYLEKPINIDDLNSAISKLKTTRKEIGAAESVDLATVKKLISESQLVPSKKLTIPTSKGLVLVNTTEIIRLEASESYTTLYLNTGKRLVSSKTIKVYEDQLSAHKFFRIHKSHIINVADHLKEFSRSEGNMAILSDGSHVPVSRRKVSEFVEFLSTF